MNFIFQDLLQYSHYVRLSGSVKICFKSLKNGNEYEMFITDFDDLVKLNKNFLKLEGDFCFRQQGRNYGIVMLED